jgi:hypothetical protein
MNDVGGLQLPTLISKGQQLWLTPWKHYTFVTLLPINGIATCCQPTSRGIVYMAPRTNSDTYTTHGHPCTPFLVFACLHMCAEGCLCVYVC